MSYSDLITYNSATALSFDNTLVQISGGALTLLPPFTLTNPVVTSQHQNTISALTSFSEVSTLPAFTAIQYQLVLNALPFWYNALNASWESSDGSFSQSNDAATINAQAALVFSQLNLITSQFLGLNIFLSTTNVLNAPILTSNTIGYSWVNSNATALNQCLITGYLADLAGSYPVPTLVRPIQFLVSCDHGFFHGTRFVEPFTKVFNFNSLGYLSASVIETATPGVKLNFSVTYYDGQSLKSTKLFNAIVPNQAQINLSNLSTTVPYDFG